MRLILLTVLGLAACYRGANPTPTSNTDSITLQPPKLAVGQRWTEVSTSVFDFEAVGGGERWPGSFTRTTTRMVEILELKNGLEARARHTYLVDHERKAMRHDGPRDEEAALTVLHGKTFFLAAGTPIVVTADDGRAVSDEELKEVRDRDGRFGKADPLQKMWLGKPLLRGQSLAATATELASYREPGTDKRLTKYVVTFRNRIGNRVELEVITAFVTGEMEATFSGRYVVDAETGMDLEFDVSGPVTLRKGDVTLRGRMRLTHHRTL